MSCVCFCVARNENVCRMMEEERRLHGGVAFMAVVGARPGTLNFFFLLGRSLEQLFFSPAKRWGARRRCADESRYVPLTFLPDTPGCNNRFPWVQPKLDATATKPSGHALTLLRRPCLAIDSPRRRLKLRTIWEAIIRRIRHHADPRVRELQEPEAHRGSHLQRRGF